MRHWLFLLLLPFVYAEAAVRDTQVQWTQECSTVNGDTLDEDGDGICELLTVGFRFYTEQGEFITGLPETGLRDYTLRYNMPWGTTCHYMTAVMDDPINTGQVLESNPSNVDACRDVEPGNPRAPVQQ